MRVLALDTTTRAGSVALVGDDCVIEERSDDPARTHAERLPGALAALLDAHDLTFSDIDLFAVASGPGSFTGLRVGIATMQGLAFTCRRPIVGVSLLEALGHLGSQGVASSQMLVAPWVDAHRGEVFAALYAIQPAAEPFDPERLTPLGPPTVADPADTLVQTAVNEAGRVMTFIGDGAVMFADVIARKLPAARILPPPLAAGAIGRLAYARARRGETVDAAALQPLYIRRPDAELARESSRSR